MEVINTRLAERTYDKACEYAHLHCWSCDVSPSMAYLETNEKPLFLVRRLTGFLDSFTHLSLDPDYAIFAFFYGCGIRCCDGVNYGRVFAIPKGLPPCEKNAPLGTDTELPSYAVNPIEVIYCDGSVNGYLEAVILANMISQIECDLGFCHTSLLFKRPKDLDHSDVASKWIWNEKVQDWKPHCSINSSTGQAVVDIVEYTYTFHMSDGRKTKTIDRVRYCFDPNYNKSVLDSHIYRRYPAAVLNMSRYKDGRHSCIFRRTSQELGATKTLRHPRVSTRKKQKHSQVLDNISTTIVLWQGLLRWAMETIRNVFHKEEFNGNHSDREDLNRVLEDLESQQGEKRFSISDAGQRYADDGNVPVSVQEPGSDRG